MKARLARSGHLSTVIGRLMVVSGGILRDGSLCVDLVIMDLSTLTFIESVPPRAALHSSGHVRSDVLALPACPCVYILVAVSCCCLACVLSDVAPRFPGANPPVLSCKIKFLQNQVPLSPC